MDIFESNRILMTRLCCFCLMFVCVAHNFYSLNDMDAHRDPAVDIYVPQDVDPQLGQIQRRPFDIVLNIDRHEPQLERTGLDRGPPDRVRFERQQEFRREVFGREEFYENERVHFVKRIYSSDFSAQKMQLFVVSCFIICMYIASCYLAIKYDESFVHSNNTDTNLKTSLDQVNLLVEFYAHIYTFCVITYVCWILSRNACLSYICWQPIPSVNSLKGRTEVAIYHYLSLGSYAVALLLALVNGYVIYESYGLGNVSTLIARLLSKHSVSIGNFYLSNQPNLVLGSLAGLAEWFAGCLLYWKHRPFRRQDTFPWIQIICGIASVLVCVGVLIIY